MKRTEYTLIPETVAEKDGITALKLALHEYHYTAFLFASGELMNSEGKYELDELKAKLETVETDDSGRDANGIDIRAALKTLENVTSC